VKFLGVDAGNVPEPRGNDLIGHTEQVVGKAHMEVTHGFNTDPLANRGRLLREL